MNTVNLPRSEVSAGRAVLPGQEVREYASPTHQEMAEMNMPMGMDHELRPVPHTVRVMPPVLEAEPCPTCDGRGVRQIANDNAQLQWRTSRCYICDGEGLVVVLWLTEERFNWAEMESRQFPYGYVTNPTVSFKRADFAEWTPGVEVPCALATWTPDKYTPVSES